MLYRFHKDSRAQSNMQQKSKSLQRFKKHLCQDKITSHVSVGMISVGMIEDHFQPRSQRWRFIQWRRHMTAMKKNICNPVYSCFYKKYSITTISNFWISYLGPGNPKDPKALNGSSRNQWGFESSSIRTSQTV